MYWEERKDRYPLSADQFVRRATDNGVDTAEFRIELVSKCMLPNIKIDCAHSPECVYHIFEGILENQYVDGPIVECGCYAGGMTAKLSYICNMLDKELYVFDSFYGLPYEEDFIQKKENGKTFNGQWIKNLYSVNLDEVKYNVEKYGIIDRCNFIPGLFEDTFKTKEADIYPSFIFIDVDLVSSMRECILYWWPRLKGNRFYTHESSIITYVDALLDKEWWLENLNEEPPYYAGAYCGFTHAPALGFLVKKEN